MMSKVFQDEQLVCVYCIPCTCRNFHGDISRKPAKVIFSLLTIAQYAHHILMCIAIFQGACSWISLVPRPSHHPVFDRMQYAKMEGGGLVHFISCMTSVSTQGRQRAGGGDFPIEKMGLRPYLVVSARSAGVSNVRKAKNVLLLA